MLIISILQLTAHLAAPGPVAAPDSRQSVAACSAAAGARPIVDGITVSEQPALPGDLPSLRITHESSGGWMSLYYDAPSKAAAQARASCLGAQLALLRAELGDDRRDVRWSSAVFTSIDYVPPRDGVDVRWTVRTGPDGELTSRTEEMIVGVLPHEQVHAFQARAGATTPLWFHEGHATWVGVKVTAKLRPEMAAAETARHERALAEAEQPINLASWGGSRVKPEAIRRQVSADDRTRMDADPNYIPPGPFSFGPSDFVSDQSNLPARYAAAWKLFTGLEARHGADTVQQWVTEMTAASGPADGTAIMAAANVSFGEDVGPLLQ